MSREPSKAHVVPRKTGAFRTHVRVGKYELRKEMGVGPTGAAWRAIDEERGVEVVLKTVGHANPEVHARIINDLQRLVEVRHPNVVRCHELYVFEDRHFLVMEYVEGIDVLTWLWSNDVARSFEAPTEEFANADTTRRSQTALSTPQISDTRIREVLTQLGEALSAVHQGELVHGDVRPSNVVVTRDGRLVLLDPAPSFRAGPPFVELAAGGAPYAAPEVVVGRPATSKADWYALGALLFEAYAGQPPFVGAPEVILQQKQHADPPPLSSRARNVPPEFDHLCTALLRRDVDDRASAAELVRVLEPNRKPRRSAMIEALTSVADRQVAPMMPLVGRHTELAQLSTALNEARRQGAVLQLVRGPHGVGKSALAAAFARSLSTDAVTLRARCRPTFGAGFAAFDAIIADLALRLRQLSTTARLGILPERAETLAEVFPELRRVDGVGGGPARWRGADPGELRMRAFAALRELFARLARHAPLVLVLDDFDLIDDDSLDLLSHLVRPPEPPRMLIVGLTSPGAHIARLNALRAAGRLPSIATLELGPLPREEAELFADIAASHVDVPIDDPVAMADAADGDPGLILELVRAAPNPDELRQDGVLPTAAALMRARLTALGPEARTVLSVLALHGRGPIDLIATAAMTTVATLVAQLDDLVGAEWVLLSGREAADHLELHDGRVREVVLAELVPDEVVALHRNLAQAIEGRDDADPHALWWHWQRAGQSRRALDHAQAAARNASEAFAFHRAIALYEAAVAEQLEAPVARALRTELADNLQYAGRHADAAARYLEAAEGGLREEVGELRRRAAMAAIGAGNVEQADAILGDTLRLFSLAEPRRASLLGGLFARRRWADPAAPFTPRPPERITADAVVAIDAQASASAMRALIAPVRGLALHPGYLDAARASGDAARYARALAAEATWRAAHAPDEVAAISAGLDRAEHLLDDEAGALDRAKLLLGRGAASLLIGSLKPARESLEWCQTTLANECRDAAWETRIARILLLWTYALQGDGAVLGHELRVWSDAARTADDQLSVGLLSLGGGALGWMWTGDTHAATPPIEAAAQAWGDRPLPMVQWLVAYSQAELALYTGDRKAADAHAQRATGLLPQVSDGVLWLDGETAYLRGRIALAPTAASDLKSAIAIARKEASALAKSTMPIAKAYAHALTAGAEAKLGDGTKADAGYRAAIQWFDQLGMQVHAAAARWHLGQLRGGAVAIAESMAAIDRIRECRMRKPERVIAHVVPGRG